MSLLGWIDNAPDTGKLNSGPKAAPSTSTVMSARNNGWAPGANASSSGSGTVMAIFPECSPLLILGWR